jgi:hypothetical protein
MTDSTKNLWQAEDPQVPSEIMLNSDMSLAYSIFDEENPHPYGTDSDVLGNHKCSRYIVPENTPGCINPLNAMLPSTFDLVKNYAHDNDAFLKEFAKSYVKMTSVGYGLNPDNEGKFGSLTPIECDK